MRRRSVLLLLLTSFLMALPVFAQPAPGDVASDAAADGAAALARDVRGWPVGDDPAAVADAAVAAWLERRPVPLADLATRDAAEVCAELPDLLANPPPPEGTRVVIEERRTADVGVPDRARYTYAAVRPSDALDVVQVDLRRAEDAWTVDRVVFRSTLTGTGRDWLQTPTASLVFALMSVVVLALLWRPGPLRRALAAAVQTVRRHRGTVIGTMVVLYAVFGVGAMVGAGLPDACDAAVLAVVEQATGQLGALEAYGSGNVLRAATVTFYQNFVVVTFGIHFVLSLLLGVPTYLIAIPQFFLLGVPFGLLGGTTGASLVPVIVLVLIELTAYFLVVSGGGIVLGTLFRRGFGGYGPAVRQAASLLLPAGLLLLAGAWYEALILIVFGA